MIKAILSFCVLIVVCSAQLKLAGGPLALPAAAVIPQYIARGVAGGLVDDLSYKPYAFGYNNADEFGTTWQRQEEADGNGAVRGSYGYKDATGIYRTVQYIADDVNGFTATVVSNEPGLVDSAPAGVLYTID